MASCESTGRELSFEWSHHRISSIDSKVRVTLQNPLKHSGSERVKSEKETGAKTYPAIASGIVTGEAPSATGQFFPCP